MSYWAEFWNQKDPSSDQFQQLRDMAEALIPGLGEQLYNTNPTQLGSNEISSVTYDNQQQYNEANAPENPIKDPTQNDVPMPSTGFRSKENPMFLASGGAIDNKISKLYKEGYTAPGQAYAIAKSMGYNEGGEVPKMSKHVKKVTQKDRYGNQMTYEFEPDEKPIDRTALIKTMMEQMHEVPEMMGIPQASYDHPGEPKGPDTVPAWLTPGEFVMNAEAVREFGPEIEAMNEHGRMMQELQGGTIPGTGMEVGLKKFKAPKDKFMPGGTSYGVEVSGKFASGGPVYASAGQFIPEAQRIQSPLEWVGGKFGIGPREDELIPAMEETPEQVITDWMTEGADINQQQRLRDLTPQGQVIVRNPDADAAAGEEAYVRQDVPTIDTPEEQDLTNAQIVAQADVPPEDQAEVAKEQNQPVPELYDIRKGDGGIPVVRQSEEQKKALNDLMDSADNVATAGEAAAAEQPGMFEKAYDFVRGNLNNLLQNYVGGGDILGGLEDFAGDAFEYGMKAVGGEEGLKTMAMQYLGSRALGYSHEDALNWTGKQLKARTEATAAAAAKVDERAFELTKSGKYTPESIRNYERTGGDERLLVPADKKGGVKVDKTNPITIAVNGKPHRVYEAQDADGNKFYRTAGGKAIDPIAMDVETDPYKIKGTKEWAGRIKEFRGVTAKQLRSLQEQLGTNEEGFTQTDLNPETAAGEVAQWAAENNVAPEELGGLVESAYADMRAQSFGKNRKSDIRPFLNQLVVRNSTGASAKMFQTGVNEDTGMPTYIDSGKLANVNNAITKVLHAQGQPNRKATDIANLYYNKKLPAWNEMVKSGESKKWENLANEGENGFYVYIANQLGIDDRSPK